MYLLIAIAVLAVILFIGGLVWSSNGKPIESGLNWASLALAPLVVVLLIGLIVFLTSVHRVNKLTAYSEANQYVYAGAAQDLRDGIPVGGETGFFDAANLKQIDSFGETVMDGRDAMVRFNLKLRTQRYWEKNMIFGIFIPDLDPSIQPIKDGT